MLTLAHSCLALIIVRLFPSPWVAGPLCLLSHFGLDFAIPHWNPALYHTYRHSRRFNRRIVAIIALDASAALGLVGVLSYPLFTSGQYWSGLWLWLAAGLAVLPDAVKIPYYFFHWENRLLSDYIRWEHRNQAESGKLWGLISQLVIVAGSLYLLFH